MSKTETLIAAAVLKGIVGLAVLGAARADQIPRTPSFSDKVQVLGAYRIKDVTQTSRSYNGTLCSEESAKAGHHDSDCGRIVWAVRTEKQVALLGAPMERSYLRSAVLRGSLFHPKCQSSVELNAGLADLMSTKLCRAIHASQLDTSTTEGFFFSEDMSEPMADAYADSIVAMAVSGLPIGISSSTTISLPKGVTIPAQFSMRRTVAGAILFIPATIHFDYQLERVGD